MRRELASRAPLKTESIDLDEGIGRVLAVDVFADREYPPFPRSMRDGFAVRAADLPGSLTIIGEVRAGEPALQQVGPKQCVEIMTGAPVPKGADTVIMVEHVTRDGDAIVFDRTIETGANISPHGSECAKGGIVVKKGTRLDYAHIAALATVGCMNVCAHARPAVSIISTGDEVVPASATPLDHQIRNSNSHSLAAQAGAMVRTTELAPDNEPALHAAIERALPSDLILFSGGVSAGKYDLVEKVLADFGAEFFFDRVLIQPGQPLVFGKVQETFFFGLPGNPASTMVTFELFAKLALQLLSGETDPQLQFLLAPLAAPFKHKTGLTRFLPATLRNGELTPTRWGGSGDVFAVARSNAFLVANHDRESWEKGDLMQVLPR